MVHPPREPVVLGGFPKSGLGAYVGRLVRAGQTGRTRGFSRPSSRAWIRPHHDGLTVFVAAEIVRARQGRPGSTQRWPWIVAFTFGLLHGFGFAGALTEIGLPAQAVPLALLFFNVGVEAGQLLFIAAVGVVIVVARHLALPQPTWAWRVPAYGIGAVAAFWSIERVAGFWS